MPDKDSENFGQKIILLIVGGLIGALFTGGSDYLLQKDKNKDEINLANRKFKSDLIIQSLDSPTFEQAMKNLTFVIQAGLIDDPEGKIKQAAEKNKPKIENSSSSNSNSNLTRNETVSSLERKGFQALLSRNLGQSQKLFESAYNAYPVYHNVDEINKLLKSKKQISNWGQEIYCPIVQQYSWGMPQEVKQQMISQGKCPQS